MQMLSGNIEVPSTKFKMALCKSTLLLAKVTLPTETLGVVAMFVI